MSPQQTNNKIAAHPLPAARTRGMALIIALILLTVLTILGVASMSSVVMQERMAGNVNLQALSFQAASAGITEALTIGDEGSWTDPSGTSRTCTVGVNVNDEWQTDWLGDVLFPVTGLPDDIRVIFRHKIGCFLPNPIPADWVDFDDYPMELLVLSRGEVQRLNAGSVEEVLSRREVEVKVAPGPGVGDCLFTVGPMADGAFDGNIGKSSKFLVEGEDPGGCPIQFANASDSQEFRDILSGNGGSDRVGNWRPTPPGITHGGLRSPWNDALLLSRALNAIKIGIRLDDNWSATYNLGGLSDPDDIVLPDTSPYSACAGDLRPVATSNVPPSAGLTYITGNLDLGGNSLVEGLVIIEGGFESSGNVRYLADLVVLGGSFDGNGLGGADSKGLIQVHNLAQPYWDSTGAPTADRRLRPSYCTDEASCGTSLANLQQITYFNIAGGGNATVTAEDCELIKNRWRQLNYCLEDMEGMVRNENYQGTGKTEFEFHLDHNDGLSSTTPPIDFPDFSDEIDSIRIELPRCGADADTAGVVLTSWREYIDRARWE